MEEVIQYLIDYLPGCISTILNIILVIVLYRKKSLTIKASDIKDLKKEKLCDIDVILPNNIKCPLKKVKFERRIKDEKTTKNV